jgi:hypothetical protein
LFSCSGHKPTVVMDAGIATEDTISWLTEHHYPYLVVSRKKRRECDEASSVVVKQDTACTVRVHQVCDEHSRETLLYCHSTRREKKDKAISNRFISRFEEALEKLRSGLHKKRCLKNYDKVLVKIGRSRHKYARVSRQFTISVTKDEAGGNATGITWKRNPAAATTRHPSRSILSANQSDGVG